MGLRNLGYDRGWLASHGLPVPVLSVGNLTVGGTGKTPTVIWLVDMLRGLGRQPGVLARGYGRAEGEILNDEGQVIAQRFPDLPQIQNPDRVASGRQLVAQHGVDLVVLDDGFQHRRIKRDLDILCMDARRPFAQGLVLPAGDLRESRTGIRRADLILLTRTEGLALDQIESRRQDLQRFAGREIPIFPCEHRPSGLRSMPAGDLLQVDALQGRSVLLLSSIARPESFRETVLGLGAEVTGHVIRRDHHVHSEEEITSVLSSAQGMGAEVLTTEKDSVKLKRMAVPHLVLEIDLHFTQSTPTAEDLGLN
jgi:tetraacyldisaccharide 4'-kinase